VISLSSPLANSP
jgi:hypothetical protein